MPSQKKFFLVVALVLAKTAFASNEEENLLSNTRWPPKERGGEHQRKPRFVTFMISPGRTKHVRVF